MELRQLPGHPDCVPMHHLHPCMHLYLQSLRVQLRHSKNPIKLTSKHLFNISNSKVRVRGDPHKSVLWCHKQSGNTAVGEVLSYLGLHRLGAFRHHVQHRGWSVHSRKVGRVRLYDRRLDFQHVSSDPNSEYLQHLACTAHQVPRSHEPTRRFHEEEEVSCTSPASIEVFLQEKVPQVLLSGRRNHGILVG